MAMNDLWEWMTPGVEAFATAASIANPFFTGLAAWAGSRTFKLRSRIGHAEGLRQRVQYALDLSLGDGQHGQLVGTGTLEDLADERDGKKLIRRKPYGQDLAMIRQSVADLLFVGSAELDAV